MTSDQITSRNERKKLYAWRRRRGICTVCGEKPAVGENETRCVDCAARPERYIRYRATGPDWMCETCGITFQRKIENRNKPPRFCSRNCAARGANNPAWKGGRTMNREYVMVKAGPGKWGYVLEHRKVMAEKLGRPLHAWETVHHKDGDPTNNDPDNLELWGGRHGRGQRTDEAPHCPTCTCLSRDREIVRAAARSRRERQK